MKGISRILALAALCVLISSCVQISRQPPAVSPPPPTFTSEASSLPQAIPPTSAPRVSATPIPSATLTQTPSYVQSIPTGYPTLASKQIEAAAVELFNITGSCQPPCWGGITPGSTTWEEAKHLLSRFGRSINTWDYPGGLAGSMVLPVPTHAVSQKIAQSDQLAILDLTGEEVEGITLPVPYCYRLGPDGEVENAAPVYVKFPTKFTRDLKVLDYFDYRFVAPFNSKGEVNSREAQRQKQAWEFPYRYVEGLDPYIARFADVKEGASFEVHSVSPLGWIMDFEKTPHGYLMVYGGDKQIRAVWLDPLGVVLKDVTLPNGQYSELSLDGQIAVTQDGSLYVLSSTKRGIEVHFVEAP